MNILAASEPYEVDISKMSVQSALQRPTVLSYLKFLNDARLLNLLYSDLLNVKKMQKPDKIYIDNTNMLCALATHPIKEGTLRETFAVNQLCVGHEVEYGKKKGDFKVDGKYTFEVGGPSKDFKQIAEVPDSYILADDIDYPYGNKLPLWIVGFLY
jgi:predicted AAA+ superfamily ATPase